MSLVVGFVKLYQRDVYNLVLIDLDEIPESVAFQSTSWNSELFFPTSPEIQDYTFENRIDSSLAVLGLSQIHTLSLVSRIYCLVY